MSVQSYTVVELMADACAKNDTNWETIAAQMTARGLDPTNAIDIVNFTYDDVVRVNYNNGGGAMVWHYPKETVQNYDDYFSTVGNSNTMTTYRADVSVPVDVGVDSNTNKVKFSRQPKSGGMTGATNPQYLLSTVGQAVTAASVGITLGKTIDSVLYSVNPDYWDSIGLSSLNPETWSSITRGDNSLGANLFNLIFGIDPDTGNAQAYMDETTYAYMAYALAQNGWFAGGDSYTIDDTTGLSTLGTIWNLPAYAISLDSLVVTNISTGDVFTFSSNVPVYVYYLGGTNAHLVSETSTTIQRYKNGSASGTYNVNGVYTLNDKTYYHGTYGVGSNQNYIHNVPTTPNTSHTNNNAIKEIGYVVLFGYQQSTIDGLGNQSGATLPNTTNWTDPNSTLADLQNQYPSQFANPLTYDSVQPDGSVVPQVYIPVAMPNLNNDNATQPISDIQSSSQIQPQVQPTTSTDTMTQLLLNLLQQPYPQTQDANTTNTSTDNITPPQNPVDTGTGNTPVPTAPSGSASALWSVYHPTQSQVNALGAWLWGSVFTTDIKKLFEDPIQGVIKLHKVFVTPVDSGTGDIVIGTLNSGVNSATVNQQYVYIDCGNVDCFEDFGNVFDYPPYTDVSLYLPFIGIVPLDCNDVMRSKINVKYGVDVFTGACLAMVEVSRDGKTVNMYQYAGVASVDYPLTNVQASNMAGGLLTMGAAIASVAITGGVTAGAAAGAIGGAMNTMKRNVGRSGGFSGNAGAMGIKNPYLIIQRPQTKIAQTFPKLCGYPTNYSVRLGDCTNHVVVTHVHVEGINATDTELSQIESLLKEGVLV